MATKSKPTPVGGHKTSYGLRRNCTRQETTLRRQIEAGVRHFWSSRGGMPQFNNQGGRV